jgi:uncharacterized membrane protein
LIDFCSAVICFSLIISLCRLVEWIVAGRVHASVLWIFCCPALQSKLPSSACQYGFIKNAFWPSLYDERLLQTCRTVLTGSHGSFAGNPLLPDLAYVYLLLEGVILVLRFIVCFFMKEDMGGRCIKCLSLWLRAVENFNSRQVF